MAPLLVFNDKLTYLRFQVAFGAHSIKYTHLIHLITPTFILPENCTTVAIRTTA